MAKYTNMANVIETDFVTSFRKLEAYKKAFDLSLEIHKKSAGFPKTEEYGLTSQLRRSSKSICANIAEGFGRQQQSRPEFKRFLMLAIGSANETQVWLDYCLSLNYINQEEWTKWEDGYDHIVRMLHKMRK